MDGDEEKAGADASGARETEQVDDAVKPTPSAAAPAPAPSQPAVAEPASTDQEASEHAKVRHDEVRHLGYETRVSHDKSQRAITKATTTTVSRKGRTASAAKS